MPCTSAVDVHVYGGSISAGSGTTTSYAQMLQKHFPKWNIVNYAIGGSGVICWLDCGISTADIIISEFRINEWDVDRLRKWFSLTSSKAKHTIVLDLWSWLTEDTWGWPSTSLIALRRSLRFGLDGRGMCAANQPGGAITTVEPPCEDISPCGATKGDWQCYLGNYPDLQRKFGSDLAAAANHYRVHGKQEGRNCYCHCDWQCYLGNYPDLQRAFGSNLVAAANHYQDHGKQDGRSCFLYTIVRY